MGDILFFKVSPANTNYVNRIIEGYEYLGVMTTIEATDNIIMLRSTGDTVELAKRVLAHLDCEVEILSEEEQKMWLENIQKDLISLV